MSDFSFLPIVEVIISMTYITYKKTQCSNYKDKRKIPYSYTLNGRDYVKSARLDGIYRYSQPPKKIPSALPRPSFMPTYLVRTSDMKVVKGSEIQEGYCTLSYSWNQSGEIIKNETGKKSHRRIDEGKHKIIFPARTVRKKPRGRKRIPCKVKFVKFEGLIQEICKDFNIKYIWYDQMCINQNDEEEKHKEIHQMHKIYSNSYCKIALIPELDTFTYNSIFDHRFLMRGVYLPTLLTSQWMSRIWTLEETLMSSKMLFVGSNVHAWWYRIPQIYYPIFYNNTYRDAARILHWAHTRTSTKEHDHVYALANAFPEVMKEIKIDYTQDLQKLIIQFYCALARHDLSILCFKNHTDYLNICKTSSNHGIKENNTNEPSCVVPIQKFDLPSWTGVYGEHLDYGGYNTSFQNYTFNGRIMQVTCSGMTNNQDHAELSALASIVVKDIPPIPQQKTNDTSELTLITRVRPLGSRSDKYIELYKLRWVGTELHPQVQEEIVEQFRNLLHFIPIQKPNFEWVHESSPLLITSIYFHQLTETLEDSASYVLLKGIQFTGFNFDYLHPRYPVIKKDGDYYKLIGMCMIKGADNFMDDITLEEQMFEIH